MTRTAGESKRGDILRIADIEEVAATIVEIWKAGRERFLADPILQDALIRRLEVIGEAAGHISKAIRDTHPKIPWTKLRGFSSLAKHEYWRVDPVQLWEAAEAMREIRKGFSRIRFD
ncbi:MAG: HepT-like ribonuclease domain-containing protein [Thermoplasmata archaeon]